MSLIRSTRMRFATVAVTVAAMFASPLVFADTLGPSVPNGNGFYQQWSPSSGTTHYTLVDEAACNGNTDYVFTTTTNQRDSFSIDITSVPDGSKITQVSITPCASKNTSGGTNSTMNVFYRYSGTNSANAGGYSLSSTTPTTLATTNFSSLSHMKSSSSTLEVGAIFTAGNRGLRLSRIAAQVTYITLAAPTGLSATPAGSQVSLSWTDNATIEDGYKIERSTDGTNFSQIAVGGVNTTNYVDTGSVLNTAYWYRVRAYNAAGNSAYSNVATANTAPSAPSSLSATPAGSVVSLSWVDNSTVETGVKIERSTDGTNFTQISAAGANATNYTDTGAALDTAYWYRVRAYNAAGNSAYSNTVSTKTAPATPSGASATAVGAVVTLVWTDNAAQETGFVIERSTNGTTFFSIATRGANTTNYTDTGAVVNTNYWYRVRAYNNAGYSAYSNTATVGTIPSAPSGLVTFLTGGLIQLNWTDNSATETAFRIERQSATGSFVEIGTTAASISSAFDNPASGTYTYRVRASNAAGYSGYSNESIIVKP